MFAAGSTPMPAVPEGLIALGVRPHNSLGGLTPAEFRMQNDTAASGYSRR